MTIKGLKDAGFNVEKTGNRIFTLTKGSKKILIEKVTDTKFKYNDNDATSHLSVLLKQING